MRGHVLVAVALHCLSFVFVRAQEPFPGTALLTMQGDLSAQMIAGIGRFLESETVVAAQERGSFWKPNLTGDRATYEKSVQPNRERLARMIGVIDSRVG